MIEITYPVEHVLPSFHVKPAVVPVPPGRVVFESKQVSHEGKILLALGERKIFVKQQISFGGRNQIDRLPGLGFVSGSIPADHSSFPNRYAQGKALYREKGFFFVILIVVSQEKVSL
jgi:hypothetical protein